MYWHSELRRKEEGREFPTFFVSIDNHFQNSGVYDRGDHKIMTHFTKETLFKAAASKTKLSASSLINDEIAKRLAKRYKLRQARLEREIENPATPSTRSATQRWRGA